MARNTIATAYVQVRPSMRGVASEVRNTYSPAGASAGSLFGGKFVGALKSAIGVAAIGKIISDSLVAGAELEQSLGGVETLYKDHAELVIQNAQAAYKTAGMSANDYMQNVTSFSAALLNGLGGDTQKAAEIADMALQDISDNANKFGTDLERITDAYQGFAKGQYQLLDNLKIGYGGTKTEMQRLLKDAQAITGVKYDINNLADVYSAIHEIQKKLDVTGTTAKEASETISGSWASLKASFKNVLSYLALGMDVEPALKAMVDTSVVFLGKNLLPAIWNIISALPSSAVTLLKAIIPANIKDLSVELVSKLSLFLLSELPRMMEDGGAMLDGLVAGFYENFPHVMQVTGLLLSSIFYSISESMPKLAANGAQLVSKLAAGFASNAPAMFSAIADLMSRLVAGVLANAPQMLASGITLIAELAVGLLSGAVNILISIPQILEMMTDNFLSYDWCSIGQNITKGIAQGIKDGAAVIIKAAGEAALEAFKKSKEALGINSPSKLFRNKIGRAIPKGMALGVKDGEADVQSAMYELASVTENSMTANLRYSAAPIASEKKNAGVNFTVHIYAAENQNANDIVDAMMIRINEEVMRKEAVFA